MSSKCHWFFFHRNQIEQILENDGDFSPIAIMLKCIKMMLTLCPMKLRRSKYVEGNNVHFLTIEITLKRVCGKNVDFSTIKITSKKLRGNNEDFLTIEITLKKVRGNNVHFSTIKITSKKLCGNNVDFLTIEITFKKVRGNNVHFSTREITSKKSNVGTTWIFWSSKLRRKSTWTRRGNSSKFGFQGINVISTSNRHWFNVVFPSGIVFLKGYVLKVVLWQGFKFAQNA